MVCSTLGFAQSDKVQWSAKVVPADVRAGEGAQIIVTAEIPKGKRIFAIGQPEGVQSTEVTLGSSASAKRSEDDFLQPYGFAINDKKLQATVEHFEGGVSFGVPILVLKEAKGASELSIQVKTFLHDKDGKGEVITETVPVALSVAEGSARPDRLDAVTDEPEQPASYLDPDDAKVLTPGEDTPAAGPVSTDIESYKANGLLPFIGAAVLAGLFALLTPCVFPMIPVTVSYFAKRQDDRNKFAGPFAYMLGIVSTFTVVGLGVSLLIGGDRVTQFATHPATNIALGLLFVVLSLSLFGVFEIQVPNWLVQKTSAGRTKGGLVGPFMMGLTFSMTSFTCTVAFVGSLLAAATKGDMLYPVIGMLVFSITFGLPFFLLALFPKYLNSLPKAGGWMSTVKASMGFLELIAAVKFFQQADLVVQAGIITKEVFLAVWSTLFIALALFLLGWMVFPKMAHEKVGWLRRGFGVAFAGIGIWLLTGLAGRNLGFAESFLPVSPYPYKGGTETKEKDGLVWLSSYQAGLDKAKAENKSLFIDFTGFSCVNCRWMEANMFPKPAISEELKKMVLVKLYTDGVDDESKANFKLMNELTKSITNPVYVILDSNGKTVQVKAFEPDEKNFLTFLKSGSSNSSVAKN